MRKRLFEIIERSQNNDRYSFLYDMLMIFAIFISIVPLAFKQSNELLHFIEIFTFILFLFDYIFRWITADYRLGKGRKSFFHYPFTLIAIIDLLSILPVITIIDDGFRLFRLVRVLKIFRYSKSGTIILNVIQKSREPLLAVCALAFGYILVSALIIFNVEESSFDSFFDAVYWATVSLTTVGYGDLYPVTSAGRVVTMFSSIFGIAIVALPAGIITAGYMDIVNDNGKDKSE